MTQASTSTIVRGAMTPPIYSLHFQETTVTQGHPAIRAPYAGTNSLDGGLLFSPATDELGAAVVVNGISGPHRRYLAAGGYGFMIGDGALSYALETVGELYYKVRVIESIAFTGDYQFVVDPAYNRDRGPVHMFGLRAHVEL